MRPDSVRSPDHVLLLVAMESELRPIADRLAVVRREADGPPALFDGRLGPIDVTVALTGVGKVAASWSATRALARRRSALVLVAGIAGGLTPGARVGALVVPEGAAQHDLDVRPLTKERGEVPGLGRGRLPSDAAARRALRDAAAGAAGTVVEGLIVSGDEIIRERDRRDGLRQAFPDATAVDMETAAVAHVCALEGVPWAAVRVISDNADEEVSVAVLDEVADRSGPLLADVVATALSALS